MHELSIAMNIVDIATEQAKKENASEILEVHLDIGTLSGVEFDALEFAMEISVKDTMLEQAAININRINAIAKCKQCKHEFDTENLYNSCPECKSFMIEIIQGKELQIKSLIVD